MLGGMTEIPDDNYSPVWAGDSRRPVPPVGDEVHGQIEDDTGDVAALARSADERIVAEPGIEGDVRQPVVGAAWQYQGQS